MEIDKMEIGKMEIDKMRDRPMVRDPPTVTDHPM